VEVGSIAVKTPAYKVLQHISTTSSSTLVQVQPAQGEDESSQTALVVGGITGFVAIFFAVAGTVLIKRRRANAATQIAPVSDAEEDNEAVARMVTRIPTNTLLQSEAVRQAWEIKERRRVHPPSAQVTPAPEQAELESQDSVLPPSHRVRHAWEVAAGDDNRGLTTVRVPGDPLAASRAGRNAWQATEAEERTSTAATGRSTPAAPLEAMRSPLRLLDV